MHKFINSVKFLFVAFVLPVVLTACSGGGGSVSVGEVTLQLPENLNSRLAEELVPVVEIITGDSDSAAGVLGVDPSQYSSDETFHRPALFAIGSMTPNSNSILAANKIFKERELSGNEQNGSIYQLNLNIRWLQIAADDTNLFNSLTKETLVSVDGVSGNPVYPVIAHSKYNLRYIVGQGIERDANGKTVLSPDNVEFNNDYDNDGLSNLEEFVLGANVLDDADPGVSFSNSGFKRTLSFPVSDTTSGGSISNFCEQSNETSIRAYPLSEQGFENLGLLTSFYTVAVDPNFSYVCVRIEADTGVLGSVVNFEWTTLGTVTTSDFEQASITVGEINIVNSTNDLETAGFYNNRTVSGDTLTFGAKLLAAEFNAVNRLVKFQLSEQGESNSSTTTAHFELGLSKYEQPVSEPAAQYSFNVVVDDTQESVSPTVSDDGEEVYEIEECTLFNVTLVNGDMPNNVFWSARGSPSDVNGVQGSTFPFTSLIFRGDSSSSFTLTAYDLVSNQELFSANFTSTDRNEISSNSGCPS